MKKEEIKTIIKKLLQEIEEEDIGISLFSTFYQNEEELSFFKEADREHVLKILKKLADDSKRHKTILEHIIRNLEDKAHAK
ncbi:MAG: hypothetical protein HYZ83_01130 [Candidatus Omnitrophica bacterium]|nr:hypothetical protein [Candidatus Omnitrophota bacterium]